MRTLVRTATSVDDHVDRLLAGGPLEGNTSIRQHLTKAVATIPDHHLTTLGAVTIKPDKDPDTRGRYWSKRYSTRTGPQPAYISFTPHVKDEKAYNAEIGGEVRRGNLVKTGLPGVRSTLHHELGHHLYGAMRQKQRDAMWKEIGAQPEFKQGNISSPQPLGPRWVRTNRSNLVKHVSTYGAYSDDEAAAELFTQHHGKYPTEASHIAFRHMTGGADEDPGTE